jgi:VCBS repeat-containing protein
MLSKAFGRVMSKKVTIAVVGVLVLALTGSIVCTTAKPAYAASSTLTILSGEEVYLSKQGGDWNKVSEEMVIVKEGDGVRTGDDSFALITFHDGSTIEIEPNTEISITEMSDTSTSVWQEVGRTWSGVKKLADTDFEVETPSAAAVARGTLIDTVVDELGNTLWAVFEGVLEVTAQGVSRTVEAGMQISVEKDKIPGEPEPIPSSRNNLQFTLKSPAWLLVVDSPEERSVGVVPPGIMVTQLPGATTTGSQSDPQVVVIPVLEEEGSRTYYVVLYGKEEGTASVEIDGYAEDQSAFHIARGQEVSLFETEGTKYVATLTVTVGQDGLISGGELGQFQATTEEGPGKVAIKDKAVDTALSNTGPTADFSATPLSGDEPLTVSFTDTSTSDDGITSWQWDFNNDGTIDSTQQNPTSQYLQDGVYTVSLVVQEADADTDTETKTNYITVSNTGPTADFSAMPLSGDEPLTVNFTDASTSYDGITSWQWDFNNDGTIDSTQQNPTFQYLQDGVYTVSLVVQEADADTDTETKTNYITVSNTGPTADFSAMPLSGSEPLTVSFSDASTSYDGITSWQWDFGDGGTSTQQNPAHTYTQDGVYTVSVVVQEADADSDTETKNITVFDTGPTADFFANPLLGDKPLTVNFTDTSTSYDGITSWQWDFGDGGTSTLQNPTHTYTQEGVYTVSLTVTEGDGSSDTATQDDYVTVENSPPEAMGEAYSVAQGGTLTIDAPGVLGNDSDMNGDPLNAVLVSDVSHGTLTLNPDGSFTYTPESNFCGIDSFTYRANDGTADSNTATVTITVGTEIVVDITSHEDGQTVDQRTILLAGTVSDTSITEALLNVDGATSTTPVTDGFFSQEINVLNGENTITVTVTNAQGCSASDTITIWAEIPTSGIRVELTWNTNNHDLDLHLVRPGGDYWEVPDDCCYFNWNPDWDNSGGPSPGDPSLDIDNTWGYGPEDITLVAPPYNGTYQVIIHFYSDHGLTGGSTATVRIWINDELVFTASRTLYDDDVWYCAHIQWPSGIVS